MITCFIRYTVAMDQVAEFEHYARVWMKLIEKYGGTHLGYFLPGGAPPAAPFSFPGLGEDGPDDMAIAMFSFPSMDAYEKYRAEVKDDPECIAITKIRDETACFTKYERTFMRAIARG